MVHRVQLTLSIECLRRLSAVSLRTQWLTTPFRSTWSGLAWADTTMPVPQVVNVVVPNADDVRFDAHYPRNFMRLLVNDCARSRSGSSLSVKGHRRRCARRLSGSLAEDV
jgi:hypothetical protein